MRIGILGGTFNPVHKGHLHIAKEALRKLDLDKVLFIPAYSPPHKKVHDRITPYQRLKMLRMALRDHEKFEISTYEIRKRGKSYSIDTARHLVKKYGKKNKFFFIVGRDEVAGLKKWKKFDELSKLVSFAVFSRIKRISSTMIRNLAKSGKSIKYLVPAGVYEYIRKKSLYVK